MSKVSARQLIALNDQGVLTKLSNMREEVTFGTRLKIANFLKEVVDPTNNVIRLRRELVLKYGSFEKVPNPNGPKDSSIEVGIVSDDKLPEYNKDLESLLDTQIPINLVPFSVADFETSTLSPAELMTLLPFLSENDKKPS